MSTTSFLHHAENIHEELRALYKRHDSGTSPMHHMLEYFQGFRDEQLRELPTPVGGKRLRAVLCLLLSNIYGGEHEARALACCIELFHHFTLIHDDIEDADEVRRGRPTVWKLWGVNTAINVGDLQLLMAYHELTTLTRKDVIDELHTSFRTVLEGQYNDVHSAKNGVSPETFLPFYMRMIEQKTASLFSSACVCMGIFANVSNEDREHLRAFGRSIGCAFQIQDDLRDIEADQRRGVHTIGTVCGESEARTLLHSVQQEVEQSIQSLQLPPQKANVLREYCAHIIH